MLEQRARKNLRSPRCVLGGHICPGFSRGRSRENVHQLGDLPALIGSIAALNGVLDAMGYVIAQHFFLDAAESRADGRNLRHDVDAVPPFLHHLGEAANLTFDAVQAFRQPALVSFSMS